MAMIFTYRNVFSIIFCVLFVAENYLSTKCSNLCRDNFHFTPHIAEKRTKSNQISNQIILLIPNAHTTNILSNKRNMAILGYHQDKILYKLV